MSAGDRRNLPPALIDKNWSLAQAQEEQALAEANGRSGPATPLFQWVALHELDQLEKQYQMGDEFSLMQAIANCARHELVIPRWAIAAYLKAYYAVVNARVGSWDEALGRPYRKGAHITKIHQRRFLRFAVYNRVRDLTLGPKQRPIDEALFADVGKEFGIKKTLCNELYYEASRIIEQTPNTVAGAVALALLEPFKIDTAGNS